MAGGTEDGNRHAAVDLADRILLPSDLGDQAGANLERTAWQLDHFTVGEVETDGNGADFSILDGEATWSDGCNTFSADVHAAVADRARARGHQLHQARPAPTNPTTEAIAGGDVARAPSRSRSAPASMPCSSPPATRRSACRPVQADATTTTTTTVGGPSARGPSSRATEWRVVALYRGDEQVLCPMQQRTHTLIFSSSWRQVGELERRMQTRASGTYSIDPATADLVITDDGDDPSPGGPTSASGSPRVAR